MYVINLNRNDIRWLQKALNKKDFRAYCNMILVHEGYAYATSGYVVHKIKCGHEEQEGLYSRDGIKIDDDTLRHPLKGRDLFNGFTLDVHLSLDLENLAVITTSVLGMGISATYFGNAVDKASSILIKMHTDKNRVLIEYRNRSAVVMFTKLTRA